MNLLESYLKQENLDETTVMNMLQQFAIISDNCITARDVSNGDCEKALAWLNPQAEFKIS